LDQSRGNDHWINPLLTRLNLVRNREEEDKVRGAYWRQIESCQLTERVGKLVSEVNREAGYHVLEMVEFLPPQKNILRISFDRERIKHNLEVVIRESGIVLMFSTTRRLLTGWGRYLSNHSGKRNSTLVWEQDIKPEEILEQNIQAWLSYLLSGLDKQFRLDQILEATQGTDAGLSEALRKLSA
jgi:hypothetical protein